MANLTLDENHVYRLDGQIIPGCTSVLKAFGFYRFLEFLPEDEREWHGDRGRAIAKAVELSLRGTLDRRTLDKTVRRYMPGWEKAAKELGITVLMLDGEPFVERKLHHPIHRYGVTPDMVVRIQALRDSGPVEIKATANNSIATPIQTACQLLAVRTVMPEIGKLRASLRLLPEAPYYDLKVYQDPMDEVHWISLLNTYRLLTKHKLLRRDGSTNASDSIPS